MRLALGQSWLGGLGLAGRADRGHAHGVHRYIHLCGHADWLVLCRAQHRAIALHEIPQPFRHRQHLLAHRQAGEDVVLRNLISFVPQMEKSSAT